MKPPLLPLILGATVTLTFADIIALPHPGEALPATSTVVWSPLFQSAWDQLNASLGGPPGRVDPPNKLMAGLDAFRWDAEKVMPVGSWQAWCGPATQDFVKQVNIEAAAITQQPEESFELKNEANGSRAFFAILNREVEFQHAFFRSAKIPLKFHSKGMDHPVRFFGVRDELAGKFASAVRVLAWRPVDGSHALQIACKLADDSLVLYLPPGNQNFATACHWLRTWRSGFIPDPASANGWDDPFVHRGDEIQIPYVTLESKADFTSQLGGIRHCGKSKLPWTISRAEQITRFQLHEKGAQVRVGAAGISDPFAEPPPTVLRRFLYDRPFFVFLWREGAEWPYFGAWIGDESSLDSFQ